MCLCIGGQGTGQGPVVSYHFGMAECARRLDGVALLFSSLLYSVPKGMGRKAFVYIFGLQKNKGKTARKRRCMRTRDEEGEA